MKDINSVRNNASKFLRMFFGCSSEGLPERQVVDNAKKACPDVIEKTDSNKYESDVEALKARYRDDFKTGLCIETTLQEMLGICPRKRRRSDAYKGLVGYLKRNYDITLIIKSQKSK